MQFTPSQHGLEQIARVHRAVGLARADDGVQLVDEEDDAALGLLDFGEDSLQSFLEFAPELRAGDQAAHVQGEDRALAEGIRHITRHDALGQALGNGGLAHAGLADEHRVVLGLAGEDADDVADLPVAPDDGVELVLPGQFDQVRAVLLQRVVGVLRAVGGDAGRAAHIAERLEEGFLIIAQALQDLLDPRIGLVAQAHPDVLDREVLVLHLLGAGFGLKERLLQVGGDIDLVGFAAGTGHPGDAAQGLGDGSTQAVGRQAALVQQLGNQGRAVLGEGEHHMLLIHLLVAVFHGDLLGPLDGGDGLLGELIHIHRHSPLMEDGWRI